MRVVERWTRPSKQTLHYEATVTDPGAYTAFTVAWDIPCNVDGELPEYICQENNQYLNRLEDDFGQPSSVRGRTRAEAGRAIGVPGSPSMRSTLFLSSHLPPCARSSRPSSGRSSVTRSRVSGAANGYRRTTAAGSC